VCQPKDGDDGASRCLVPGCERPVHVRGLCAVDYAAFRKLVNRQPRDRRKKKEKELVAKGCVLPVGRNRISRFEEMVASVGVAVETI
jgi:hypothetical protein